MMKFKALLLFGILLFLVGTHLYEAYEAWYNGDEDLVNVFDLYGSQQPTGLDIGNPWVQS